MTPTERADVEVHNYNVLEQMTLDEATGCVANLLAVVRQRHGFTKSEIIDLLKERYFLVAATEERPAARKMVRPDRIGPLVNALSYQDTQRILQNLLWDVFGDVNDEGLTVLVPHRQPDKVDVASLLESLRQEFFPESCKQAESH
jgi:hypothetical protein